MKTLKLTCALLLSAWVSSANATLIFDFSFTNSANGGGFVIGEILGLDEGTGSASSVRIVSNTGGFGVGEYVSLNARENLFTVDNGMITDYNFISYGSNNLAPVVVSAALYMKDITIGLGDSPSVIFIYPRPNNLQIERRMVDVPEPGTVILLSLGLAGLSFARYRR